MESPYGEQYRQEGNPRAYMKMRDYRDLPYQWQQPVERNPSEYRFMRDYRDQWMSSPYGSTYNHSWGNHTNSSWEPRPPQYAPPEPPCYAPTSQQQQPPPLSPVEQAILNLSKQVDNFIKDNRVVNVQASREIETVKSSLNKRTDGLQSEMELKSDNLQCSILKLAQQLNHAEEESQEDECLTETILGEQVQLQPQEELKVELVEAPPEELHDALESGDTFCPWKKEEQIIALRSEEGSGKEIVEDPQKHVLQPIPTNPTANAKTTYSPLPVYILPTPVENPKPAAPAPKGKSNPSLHVMQNIKELVAIAQAFATTSKKMATAYIAWHSGWFGCGFGFGAPGPRHF